MQIVDYCNSRGILAMANNNFFDVTNVDHLVAYKYLTKNGTWPDDFDCAFSLLNLHQVQALMAKRWVDAALAGRVFGIPGI